MTPTERMLEREISLIDIFCFFKSAYKVILITGLSGLIISGSYLYLTPRIYEAVALIAVAQIADSRSGNSNNNLNPLGINIEEPSHLVARFSIPNIFTPQVLGSCAQKSQINGLTPSAMSVMLALPKGVANAVELKVYGVSPEETKICAQAIFELIKASQAEVIQPYIDEAQNKLEEDKLRLKLARDQIAKADKSGLAMSAVYLSTKDEIRFLLEEIAVLTNVVSTNKSRATRLVSPIYVGLNPASPKRSRVLVAGFGGGILFGLFLVSVRKQWSKGKKEIMKAIKNI